MATKKLTQFLTSPSKVASALDWKKTSGSILSLKIDHDSFAVNVAHHPSMKDERQSFQRIPIKYKVKNNRKVLVESVTDTFQDIIQANKVCGFVVDWPLQKEGRMGASCGRVLHILDSLLEAQVLSPNRKFCLWDSEHVPMEEEDRWGRCSTYSRHCEHADPVTRRGNHNDVTLTPVADLWQDFSQTHWPALYGRKERPSAVFPSKPSAYDCGAWLDHYEKEGTSLQTSAL